MNIIRARCNVLATEMSYRCYIVGRGLERFEILQLEVTDGFELGILSMTPYIVRTAIGELTPVHKTFWGDL